MVSAPDTNWTSRPRRPRRRRARRRAAATPYSTKFRPHLPHGCMPTPSTATSCAPISSSSCRPTGFHFQTRYSCSSSLNSGVESRARPHRRPPGRRPRRRGTTWPSTTSPSATSSTAAIANGSCAVGRRDERRRRLVLGIGVGPDLAPPGQRNVVELGAAAVRVRAADSGPGEHIGATARAALAEQRRFVPIDGEPAVHCRYRCPRSSSIS